MSTSPLFIEGLGGHIHVCWGPYFPSITTIVLFWNSSDCVVFFLMILYAYVYGDFLPTCFDAEKTHFL